MYRGGAATRVRAKHLIRAAILVILALKRVHVTMNTRVPCPPCSVHGRNTFPPSCPRYPIQSVSGYRTCDRTKRCFMLRHLTGVRVPSSIIFSNPPVDCMNTHMNGNSQPRQNQETGTVNDIAVRIKAVESSESCFNSGFLKNCHVGPEPRTRNHGCECGLFVRISTTFAAYILILGMGQSWGNE